MVKDNTSRKPRILWANFYCLLDTSSGASISVREILCQLVKEGFDVNIIGAMTFDSEKGVTTLQKHLEVIDESECINIDDAPLLHKLIVTKSRFRQEMTAKEENDWYWLYIKTLEEFKPDLVFFYGGQPLDFLISLEARQRGIPSAAYLVNANYRGTRWCRDIDLFITDSSATSNFYATNFGIMPIACGKFIDSSKVIAKKKTRKNILFINPSLQKGVGIVIQLAILLEKRRPDITFEVVESRGDWHLLLKEISENLGESRESLANVIVTPNTNDMRPVYGRAKLLLAPSLWWESGARVLAEAMLNGIPAIVTDYGGSPEMVGNAGVKIKLPEECHEKPFDRLPKVELLEPLIQMIERFYDDQDFYNNYVERATHVGQTVHNIKVSTQRVVQAFAPYIKRYAGDFDQATLLKYTHKHHLQESVNIKKPPNLVQKTELAISLAAHEKGLFIDCGGYDGCSAVKFILQNPSFEAITFEPNPLLASYYNFVPTTLIKKAAYIHNNKMTFTLDETDADGSSLIESKKIDFLGKISNQDCPKIQVECIDLSDVIKAVAKQYDYIVLKLDIEGAEYDVLEKLIKDDLIKHIKIIYAEFHWHKCGFNEKRHSTLIDALKKQTRVEDWDALDFSVYRRSEEQRTKREEKVIQTLGNIEHYQKTQFHKFI